MNYTFHSFLISALLLANKWNCELTAGVATIDGLDYVFTKCDANFLF